MNIARTEGNFNNDFVIDGNHARMSFRKAGEITKTADTTVLRWFKNSRGAALIDDEGTQTPSEQSIQGARVINTFDGVQLKAYVSYLALDAKRISKEVRKHNIKLLCDASDYGFQVLIDRMAGLSPSAPKPQQQAPKEFKPDLELTPDLIANTIDLIFKGVNIKPEIVAGVKMNAIKKEYPMLGESVDNSMAILRENTASDIKLMTPRELGRLIGVSAQEINKRLIAHGLQTKNDAKKSRKDTTYLPTDRGAEFCSYTLSTGSKDDKTTYQQLLWYESVLSVID